MSARASILQLSLISSIFISSNMTKPNQSERDTSGIHLWLVLWKAQKALERHATRNIETAGICRSDFGVLEALLHKGPLPVNALGAKVLLTSGSITTAVDRLEGRELVERRGDAADRRARIVHLTAAGRNLIRKLFAKHEEAMEKAASGLAPEERVAMIGLLRKLGRGAEEMSEERGRKKAFAKQ
jgi:MarR family transcriptional regulator, 2-MHQ and catechol-resistance regulon repressor